MKLSIKTTVMIFSCFLLTIIYHFFFKINNDQSENWEPVHSQSFQEQSIIRSDNSDKNKMFDHSSDPIDSHKAALKKNHGFRSNKSTSSQNLENSVTQDLTPIKPPDKETMKQIGITCDSIIKKHAGQLDPEFNKLQTFPPSYPYHINQKFNSNINITTPSINILFLINTMYYTIIFKDNLYT